MKWFHTHLWSIRKKKKSEGKRQQQPHRPQEWTHGYERECEWGGWVGREVREGKWGITSSTHNVGGWHAWARQDTTAKISSTSTAYSWADGQWLLQAMRWGLDNGGSLVTIMLLMELFSTDTKIKRNTQYLGSGFHFTWFCKFGRHPPHRNHSSKHTHSVSRKEAPLWHNGIFRRQCCSCKLHPQMAGTAQPWGAVSS